MPADAGIQVQIYRMDFRLHRNDGEGSNALRTKFTAAYKQ